MDLRNQTVDARSIGDFDYRLTFIRYFGRTLRCFLLSRSRKRLGMRGLGSAVSSGKWSRPLCAVRAHDYPRARFQILLAGLSESSRVLFADARKHRGLPHANERVSWTAPPQLASLHGRHS